MKLSRRILAGLTALAVLASCLAAIPALAQAAYLWGPFDFSSTSDFVPYGSSRDLVPRDLANNRASDLVPGTTQWFQQITYDTAGLAGRDPDDVHMKVAAKGKTPFDPSPDFQVNADFVGHVEDEAVHFGLSVLLDDPKMQGMNFAIQPRGLEDNQIKANILTLQPSGAATGGKPFRQGEWARLDVVWKPKEKLLIGYIDGEEAVRRQPLDYTLVAMKFRYSIEQGDMDFAFYLDDMALEYGDMPTFTPASSFLKAATGVTVNPQARTLTLDEVGVTWQQLLDRGILGDAVTRAKVYTDRSYTKEVGADQLLHDGNMAVVTDGVSYSYWTIHCQSRGYALKGLDLFANGQPAQGRFAQGEITAQARLTAYTDDQPVSLLLAQYDAESNVLLNTAVAQEPALEGPPDAYAGTPATLTAALPVEQTQGTVVRAMVWQGDAQTPLLTQPVTLRPVAQDRAESVLPKFPDFAGKAVTFSFDEGLAEDSKIIQALNQYGAKGTFNLVSDQNVMAGALDDETKKAALRQTYGGQEIANHVKGHPAVGDTTGGGVSSAQAYIDLIQAGRRELESVFGEGSVAGLAWPYDDPVAYAADQPEMAKEVSNYVKNDPEIVYARRGGSNGSFDLPGDFKDWVFTARYEEMAELGTQFLDLEEGESLKLMSVWGRADQIGQPTELGNFLGKAAAQNIWMPTNRELAEYVNALRQLTRTAAGVTNHSDQTLYLMVNYQQKELEPGETYRLGEGTDQLPAVFLAGDDTCEDVPDSEYPRAGWGTMLRDFLPALQVDNSQSLAGMSTRTFLDPQYGAGGRSRYDQIMDAAKPGDYVFIQLGRGDSVKEREEAYTTLAQYRENLTEMAARAQAKGVVPVFLTATRSCAFDDKQFRLKEDGVEPYRQVMRELGPALGVTVIDLGALHGAYLEELGISRVRPLFLFPYVTAEYTGETDTTRLSEAGAQAAARLVAQALRQDISLCLGSYVNIPAQEEPDTALFDYDYRNHADYVMVHTDYLQDVVNEMEGKYPYSNVVPNGNTITCNRLKLRNDPNRDNSYIIIEKTTPDDAYVEFSRLNPISETGRFPYYYLDGRVRADKLGAQIYTPILQDNTTVVNVTTDILPLKINADGGVQTGSGKVVKTLAQGEWLNYRIVLNLGERRCQVYIDDQLADDFAYTEGFNQPCKMLIRVDSGDSACTATWEHLRVIGLRHPFDINNPDDHPTFFSSDDSIDQWFADKTAFYGYSQNVASQGKKHVRVYTPLLRDGILYVTPAALNVGYGMALTTDPGSRTARDGNLTLTADSSQVAYLGETRQMTLPCIWENGELYVPVETFAKRVLGHDVKNDGNGLIVTGARPFFLDTYEETPEERVVSPTRGSQPLADYKKHVTPVRALNWYMSFERPSVETLREDYLSGTDNGTMHPRILANPQDIARIKADRQTDSVLNQIVNQCISRANSELSDPARGLDYNIYDMQRILNLARTSMDRVRRLAFAYQITGDKKYADAVWKIMDKVLRYPDWNPSHNLDSAELSFTVAMGYDWIYDTLTQEQKDFCYTNIKRLSMDLYWDTYRDLAMIRDTRVGTSDFVTSKSNVNVVNNGGVMAMALAFMEYNPELCTNLLAMSVRSMEYGLICFRPDGAWSEGANYWDYVGSYMSKGVESLMKCTGHHYGLLDAQGLQNAALWIRAINGFCGVNDFHDCGRGALRSMYIGWHGQIYDNPAMSAAALNQILRDNRSAEPEDALWYRAGADVSEDDLPKDIFSKGMDVVISRASYTNADDMFFSAHGGLVTCVHSQVDVGTYVLDMLGARWADDLGSEDYNIRAEMNFQVYRDRAEAHNLIVFNPDTSAGQDSRGGATTLRYESKDRGAITVYDMAGCYSNYVRAYQRGFLVGDDRRSLTVRDEFTPKATVPSDWFVTTAAKVEIVNDHTIRLTQNGKSMLMELDYNVADAALSTGPCQPLETSPHPVAPSGGKQNPNTGFTRIRLHFTAQAGQESHITVRYRPEHETVSDFSTANLPIDQWQIPEGTFLRREPLTARIFVDGTDLETLFYNKATQTVPVIPGWPLPEVTALPDDPAQSVEILPDDPPEAGVTVRIYSKEKRYYQDVHVPYQVMESADLGGYSQLTVKDCTVSAAPEAANQPENMFDGSFCSRWSSANESGSWAVFDLGAPARIDGAAMAFWQGDARRYHYELLTSNDGRSWASAAQGSSSGRTEGFELAGIPAVQARYLKFLGGGNSVNGHSNILEFRVLQKK